VLAQWDAIKRLEKGTEDKPFLHGIGIGLPALMRAAKLQKKAASVGFDWPDEVGVIGKIMEELLEYEEAIECGDAEHAEEELGDLLFSVVNLIRFRELQPEQVMAAANRKFEQRFSTMEQAIKEAGSTLAESSLEEMERQWQAAKDR
jgi:MazG family protein